MSDPATSSSEAERKALLRVAEVAEILGDVSPRVVYEWLARGIIPPEVMVRAGRAVYVKRRALEAWLDGRNGVAPAPDNRP
jgi:excisionase family DNA binding protein